MQVELLDILDVADPWVVQCPQATTADIKQNLIDQVDAGMARLFYSKDGQTLWLVQHCSFVVAEVHLFSKARAIVSNCREIQGQVWRDTLYKKLEMRTHLSGVAEIASRIGWRFEGFREASFQTKEGLLIGEYLYGVTRNG